MLGIVLGAAAMAGIFLGSLTALPWPAVVSLGLSAGVVLALWWRSPVPRLASLGLIALLVGMARYGVALPTIETIDDRSVAFYHDTGVVRLAGEVAEEPMLRDRSPNVVVSARRLWTRGEPVDVEGAVLLRLPQATSIGYGDEIEVSGELSAPLDYPGFAYREYLARQGVYSYMDYPRIIQVGTAGPSDVRAALYRLKGRLSDALARALPAPESALARGIVLGVRTDTSAELRDALAQTGTTHIVAVSGFNVAIVAGLSLRLGRRWLSLRAATAAAVASIAIFAAFVGPQPSVVRAALMGGLVVLASYYGRPGDAATALALSGAAMALHYPNVLWDIGFQLSFLATAGIIGIVPSLQAWLSRTPSLIGENMAVTLAAQVATLPVLIVNFGQLPLLAPPVNLVVLPLVGPAMLFSAITAIGGAIWAPLGYPPAWLAYVPLHLMIRAIEVGASLPIASAHPGPLPDAFPWLYYAGLGLLLGWRSLPLAGGPDPAPLLSRLPLKATLLGLAVAAVLVWTAALQAPDGRLHVVFLDVGQGDAILIRTPSGQQVLVDGGPSPTAVGDALGRQMPFWDRSLDLVVLTHPDDDHLSGLLEVVERYDVAQALEPGCENESPSYARWRQSLEARGVKRVLARAGQEVELGGGLRLRILNPAPALPTESGACGADLNARSIVTQLESPSLRVLLTGDLESVAQAQMLSRGGEVASQVLKVPHHGAREALSQELMERVSPEVAIVSVGQGNRYGHPTIEAMSMLRDRGVRVYRTDLDGTVEIIAVTNETGGYEVVSHGK